VSCAGPVAAPLGKAAEADTVLGAVEVRTDAAFRFGSRGRFRVVHGSVCRAPGRGSPLVWPGRTLPRVGAPLRVQWTTTPTAPYISGPVFLLLSFGDTPSVELPPVAGFPGCTLHVDPDPRNLYAIAPARGSILTQDGGQVWLHWTPPASFAGVELNCQLVAHAPGANAGGWLFSPGLEMWIGAGG